MSRPPEIKALIKAGRLFCLPSAVTGDDTVRTLFISPEVLEAVSGPFAETYDGIRLLELRQTLDAFLEGAEFTVADHPFGKRPDAMLAPVAPVEYDLWDIRSIAPVPGIRVLGGFWSKNVFVALTWEYRENLETSEDWEHEIERCQAEWKRLFGTRRPFRGESLDEYLSEILPV